MVRFGVRNLKTKRIRLQVSIPVWCDLETEKDYRNWKAHFRFNSSMVRFGVRKHGNNEGFYVSFNSSMVRFGEH